MRIRGRAAGAVLHACAQTLLSRCMCRLHLPLRDLPIPPFGPATTASYEPHAATECCGVQIQPERRWAPPMFRLSMLPKDAPLSE